MPFEYKRDLCQFLHFSLFYLKHKNKINNKSWLKIHFQDDPL
jgi:hypothetical protein